MIASIASAIGCEVYVGQSTDEAAFKFLPFEKVGQQFGILGASGDPLSVGAAPQFLVRDRIPCP